jgi:hypothetical protein
MFTRTGWPEESCTGWLLAFNSGANPPPKVNVPLTYIRQLLSSGWLLPLMARELAFAILFRAEQITSGSITLPCAQNRESG